MAHEDQKDRHEEPTAHYICYRTDPSLQVVHEAVRTHSTRHAANRTMAAIREGLARQGIAVKVTFKED